MAYPGGIRYDKLHHVSDTYRRLAEERYGSLEQFIIRLDKRCNRIFAMAFLLAMSMSAIGIIYLLLFIVILVLKNYLAPELVETIADSSFYVLALAAVMVLALQFLAKRRREWTRLRRISANIQLNSSSVFLPVFYRPIMYLSMAFMSNASKKKYLGGIVLITLAMMFSTVFVTIQKAGQLRNRNLLETRAYYSSGAQAFKFQQAAYDNLREAGAALPLVSIPNDMVEGSFLPLFVQYPEYLDERLGRFCTLPELPDAMPAGQLIYLRDSLRLRCMSQFFQVRLNDSLTLSPEWMFGEKYNSKGLVGYLETRQFRAGKNRLELRVPSAQKSDSLVVFGSVPFWYSEK